MTTKTFHFISGLPRSGSTLLSALLKQNPRFHAGMTSGLGSLINANIQIMSPGSESALLINEQQRPLILKGLAQSFYSTINNEVIFDTNRHWCSKMALLNDLFPQAKIIACVRDIPWIMDSIEQIIRKNPYQNSPMFNGVDNRTVYSRVDSLAQHNSLVGFAWSALKEAYYGEQANNLLIVEYNLLAQTPEKVLRLIYEFINEPWYESHDYDNVDYDAPSFDESLGLMGLHKVRPKVSFQPRATLLPPDLFSKFKEMDFWRDGTGTKAHRIVLKKQE